jgi:hypothetical protein
LGLPGAGERPAIPEDLDLVLWYDLSPMRPDEYMRQNAWRWQEAVTLRSAYLEGKEDATREKHTRDTLMQKVQMQA